MKILDILSDLQEGFITINEAHEKISASIKQKRTECDHNSQSWEGGKRICQKCGDDRTDCDGW